MADIKITDAQIESLTTADLRERLCEFGRRNRMEAEERKTVSSQYRSNWELLFNATPGENPVVRGDWEKMRPTYPNGCPILSEANDGS